MAENHYDTNPYHYVLNNPMLYMDYMGLDTTYNGGSLKEVKITGPAKGTGSGNSYYGYGSGWGDYDPFDTDNGYGGSGEFGSFNFMIPPPPPPVLSSSSGAFTSLDNRGANQGGQPRPAWDYIPNGKFDLFDASHWYRHGRGKPLTIPASSLDLSKVSAKGWKVKQIHSVPLLTKNFFSDGTIYGTLDMRYLGNNRVEILPNKYDFDIGADKGHPWNREFFRNVSTWLGEQFATGSGIASGHGTPYWIIFSGTATLGQGHK